MDKVSVCLLTSGMLHGLFCIGSAQKAFGSANKVQEPFDLIKSESCLQENEIRCLELRERIALVWQEMQSEFITKGSYDHHLAQLEINQAVETYQYLSRDHKNSDQSSLEAINRKYDRLRELLDQTVNGDSYFPYRADFSLGGDGQYTLSYSIKEFEAVNKVNQKFGVLEIPIEKVSTLENPKWFSYEVKKPWAGYWYPKYDPILYYGDQSVLSKFDRIMNRYGQQTKAQEYEKELLSGLLPESWEGLCNAWSLASIMEPEPTKSIQIHGESLDVSDQKALLTKMYENYPVEIYGVRYNGDFDTDGTYQDIRPEALHLIFEVFLKDKKRAFIIDDSADAEVWQQPIFKADWAISPDRKIPYSYVTSLRLWKIKPRDSKSNLLTDKQDYSFYEYFYRLHVDPKYRDETGKLRVIAGEWINSSIKYHPDYIVVPQESGKQASFNPSIDQNMDLLKQVLNLK